MAQQSAYLVTNRISSAATLTSSTEDATYVLENLYDAVMAKTFRFTVSTGGWIEIDFGSAIAADTIAILNHNFDSGATVTLKSGNSPAPSTTLVSMTYRQYDMWARFTDPTHRYYRLEISESNSAETEIGELVIGTRVALSRGRAYGEGLGLDHRDVFHETVKGVKYVYNLFDRRSFEETFQNCRAAQLAELNAMDAAVVGRKTPFVWIPDVAGADVYYVRKEPQYRVQSISRDAWTVQMLFEEESRGGFVEL